MAGGWNDLGRLINPSVSVYNMRPDARPRVEWEAELARRRAGEEERQARQRAADRARHQTYMSAAPVRDDRPVLRDLGEVRRAERERATPQAIRSMEQTADSLINPVTAAEFARDAGSAARRVVNSATFGLTGKSKASADDLVLLGSALATGRVARAPTGRGSRTPGIFRKAFGADATEAARAGRDVAGLTRKVAEARKVFDSAHAQEAAVKEYRAATAAADHFDAETSKMLRAGKARINQAAAMRETLADAILGTLSSLTKRSIKTMGEHLIEEANNRADSPAGRAIAERLARAAAEIQRTGVNPDAVMEALAEKTATAKTDLVARMDELKARREYEASVYHAPNWLKNSKPKKVDAKIVRFIAEQGTSRGFGPRMLSYAERAVGGVFGDVQGKPGEFLHAVSSPGANAVLLDALALYGIGGYTARKMGWWDPDRSVVEDAEAGTRNPTVAGTRNPTVDAAVTQISFDSVRQDFARDVKTDATAARAARDAALANMDPEAVKAETARIRDQVFRIHNPGMTIEGLSGSPEGKAYVDRFDADVFHARPVNEWLSADLDQYSSDMEAHRAEGGL